MLQAHLSRRDWMKVSAAGVLGTMTAGVMPGISHAHDGAGKYVLDFSLADVGYQQKSEHHPRTGQITTQNERRAMLETRIIGMWKCLRDTRKMADESAAEVRGQIKYQLENGRGWLLRGMQKYETESKNTLVSSKPRIYRVNSGGYAWGYPGNGLGRLVSGVKMNQAWAEKNLDADMLGFLGIRVPKRATPLEPALRDNEAIGQIRNDMTFKPLTEKMISLLDHSERSHTQWVKAVKDKARAEDLNELVRKHHKIHHELEFSARDNDELTLIALQPHTHDIDWARKKDEIDKLLDRADARHKDWVKFVKARDFKNAWFLSGFNHTRLHIMLAYSEADLPELTL